MMLRSMSELDHEWIVPDWPAPANVQAGCSTRQGGVSVAPYASLNLGDHVGDAADSVADNRRILRQCLNLPAEPLWLSQVHGTGVVDGAIAEVAVEADAVFSRQPDCVCTVMTADCLPVLLCDQAGTVVAAVHAGWRGLVDGVIEATVKAMGISAATLMAWLGPAIGPDVFEVGDEVRQQFISINTQASRAFKPSAQDRWLADIYMLARQRLNQLGIEKIYGGHWCTFNDAERFFSYRRDGVTGRMASLIWLSNAE